MRNLCNRVVPFAALPLLIVSAAAVHPQMVSPSIDRPDQPFSYFSKPPDEIGMIYD